MELHKTLIWFQGQFYPVLNLLLTVKKEKNQGAQIKEDQLEMINRNSRTVSKNVQTAASSLTGPTELWEMSPSSGNTGYCRCSGDARASQVSDSTHNCVPRSLQGPVLDFRKRERESLVKQPTLMLETSRMMLTAINCYKC